MPAANICSGHFIFMQNSIQKIYEIYKEHPEVCTDTRAIKHGSIFFALKGDNFNGNKFALQALESGCSYSVVDDTSLPVNEKLILVNDTLKALQDVSTLHRKTLDLPVIGITGSNGKTTTKELVYSVLSQKFKVYATKGNLNNHIGVPLTLLSLTKEIELAVLEMGANKPLDIDELCNIALPDYGLITNVGKAHLEGMGGFEGVVKTKTELYRFIKANNGLLFVNKDNLILTEKSENIKRKYYGTTAGAEIQGKMIGEFPFISLKWKNETDAVNLDEQPEAFSNLTGKYNFENILAAICIGNHFGLSDEQINKGIAEYAPTNNRSQVVYKGSNVLILDAYNANPTSMEASITNFYNMSADKTMLILGEMLELGEESDIEHLSLVSNLRKLNFNNVFLVGSNFIKLKSNFTYPVFNDVEQLIIELKKMKISDSHILIKGSRKNKLEKVEQEVF